MSRLDHKLSESHVTKEGGGAGGAAAAAGAAGRGAAEAGSLGAVLPNHWRKKLIQGYSLEEILLGVPFESSKTRALGRGVSLCEAEKAIRSSAFQDVILVLGNTGSGKSTLVNYLLGHRFEKSYDKKRGEAYLEVVETDRSLPVAEMGAGTSSCTLYPENYRARLADGQDIYYCDCPGFGETRALAKVVTNFSIDMVVRSANTVKGLVLVIQNSDFFSGRALLLRSLVHTLGQVIKMMQLIEDDLAFDSIANSLLVVYNFKDDTPRDLDQIKAKLESLIEFEEVDLENLEEGREDGEESDDFLAARGQHLEALCVLALLKKATTTGHFVLTDFMDSGEQRSDILSVLNDFSVIPKEYISFSSVDEDQRQFIQGLIEIVVEANQLISELQQIDKTIKTLESRRLRELRDESESNRAKLAFLSKFQDEKPVDVEALKEAAEESEESLALRRTCLDEAKKDQEKLRDKIAAAKKKLADLNTNEEVVCGDFSYNNTYADSASRAVVMGAVAAAAGGAAAGVLYATVGLAGMGGVIGLAGVAKKGWGVVKGYLGYKTFKYSGAPFKSVKYSNPAGIVGDLELCNETEGMFRYRMNLLRSSKEKHVITLSIPKKDYRSNPGEIVRLMNLLGSEEEAGLLKEEVLLAKRVVELQRMIDEESSFVATSFPDLSIEKRKEQIAERVAQLKHDIELCDVERAEILEGQLPKLQSRLDAIGRQLEGRLELYKLVQRIAHVLQLHLDEDETTRVMMDYFYQTLAMRGICILTDPPGGSLTRRPAVFGGGAASAAAARSSTEYTRSAFFAHPPFASTSMPEIEGLTYEKIPGDDHCLFHAVGLYLGKDKNSLRNAVADYIQEHLDEFRDQILAIEEERARTPEEYIAAVRANEWADNLEISVLMRMHNRPIVVIGPDGKIRNQIDFAGFPGEPIFVHYNSHNHYDAYVLADGWHGRAREIVASLIRLNEHSCDSSATGFSFKS